MFRPFLRYTALVCCWLIATGDYCWAEPSLEYQVKGAFLSKFSDYVEWPAGALADNPQFGVCIVGTDPFGTSLDDILRGQRVGTLPLALKRLDQLSERDSCRIVFLSGVKPQQLAAALKISALNHALTVTDEAAGDLRGVINFVIRDNHVRFEIDDQLASASGLTISSKLMNLAVSVRSRAQGDAK